ncbi:AarF/ABC1/UbiB kinase family protein [Candidatus Saccharibacteria bacterium]|nr:AarF/ABC1/UbiB kinase family protein [Candidatus Saccharibacteria bacterium]
MARLFESYNWQSVLLEECERLGGVYIKFIQMLAVHETTKHLVEGARADLVYEHVPFEAIDVNQELGRSVQEFAWIDYQPFAGGSYGQVYRGQLRTGQDVVVKILRPSVRKTLRQDLRILNSIARITSWFTRRAIVDPLAIAQEFSRTTIAETNYRREVQNAEWQRSFFERRNTLVIPRSYVQLSSDHILVQDYVGGISLAEAMLRQSNGEQIDRIVFDATGSNVWSQLEELGEEFLDSMLYADYNMADPHPGNIRLLPNDKVALIDFGMVSRAPSNKAAVVNVMGEYVKIYEDRFDAGSFATSMLAFFDVELHDALQIVAREFADNYIGSLEGFIDNYFKNLTNDGQIKHYLTERRVSRLFDQVINSGNKLGIRISKENVMQQRSMSMFASMIRAIGEAHDGQVNFALMHGITSRVYRQALRDGVDQPRQPEMTDERAFEVAANWLTTIAENDRHMYGFITKGGFA